MNYRYTINGTDVNPRGDWELSYERNEGQIFFRKHLRGELTFQGADYDLIMGMADCDVLEFKIYCGTTEEWEGQFKMPYDFEIDTDSCFLKGEPKVVDEYSCIMDHYETEWTLPGLAGGITPQIRSCAGVLLHTLPVGTDLFVASTASGSNNYLDYLINSVDRMDCGLTISSSFMFRENFPNGDNYAASYGVNNYITGAGNRLEYIYALTNNALRSSLGGTLCDGIPYYTFKNLEEVLRIWFNAYWYIDQNGDFRIEHIRFFDPDFPESDFEPDIDLTTLTDGNGRYYAYRRNKYTYETGRLYDQERWTMQHFEGTEGTIAHGTDFEGVPVFYGGGFDEKSDCVPGVFKEKEFATQRFWSDIYWAYQLIATATIDTIKCPGWVLMDVDTATNWIRCETGIFSGGNVINGHLSIANLQDSYHTWDRIFLDGDMNFGGASPVVLFDSEIKKQLQEAIEFPLCCDEDFDPLDTVRTELGNGAVKAAIQKKNSIEVKLLY